MARIDLMERVTELGDRVNGHPERVAEVVPQLLVLLRNSQDPALLAAIAEAIGHAWDERTSLELVTLVGHPDVRVRRAVARALPAGIESVEATVPIADALMSLCRDDDEKVRDWATFGLARQLSFDTYEVRELLWLLTSDESDAVRDEALVGLARRRDGRSFDLVVQRLAGSEADGLVFEAAEYLADPRLQDHLAEWRDSDPEDDDIDRACRACDSFLQKARIEQYASLLAAVQRILEERGHQGKAAMVCDRFTADVLLMIDTVPLVWFVDAVLHSVSNDFERAARDITAEVEQS